MNSFISQLSKSLFWDTDINDLEPKKHISYIVERVLSRGTWNDFLVLKEFYDKTVIVNAVKNLRYLDKRVLHFCSTYFEIPLTDFRCYTNLPSNQTHWSY